MKYIFPLAFLFALTGCSDAPKPVTETKKEPEKIEPITGREAFYKMYPSARAWAADALGLQMKSIQLTSVKADKGKAGAWQCTFVSAGRGRSRMFSWSAIEAEGNLHKGVFAGPEEGYAASRQLQPFLTAALKTDTDAIFETAVKKVSADTLKKEADKPVNFILEQTPRFPNLVWRVLWGESVATSYTVFVDATTGQFLERTH